MGCMAEPVFLSLSQKMRYLIELQIERIAIFLNFLSRNYNIVRYNNYNKNKKYILVIKIIPGGK